MTTAELVPWEVPDTEWSNYIHQRFRRSLEDGGQLGNYYNDCDPVTRTEAVILSGNSLLEPGQVASLTMNLYYNPIFDGEAIWERGDDILGPLKGPADQWEPMLTHLLPLADPKLRDLSPLLRHVVRQVYLMRAVIGDQGLLDAARIAPPRHFNLLLLNSAGTITGYGTDDKSACDPVQIGLRVQEVRRVWSELLVCTDLPSFLHAALSAALIEKGIRR